MAEERIDPIMVKNYAETPVAPVTNESDCLNISANDHSHSKQNATGEKPKMVPNYLRASTGSCHDFCKYGRKHPFEEMVREPLRKRIAKRLQNQTSYSVEAIVSDTQKKKEKLVRQRLLVNTKKDSSSVKMMKPSPDIINSYSPKFRTSFHPKASSPTMESASPYPYPPEIIKREIIALPSMKVEVHSVDTKSPRMSVKLSSLHKLKPVKVEPLSASDHSNGENGKLRRNNNGISTVRKMTASASAKKVSVPPPPPAPLSPRTSLAKTASGKSMKDRRLFLSRLKNQSRVESEGTEKILRVIKIGTENDALDSTPDDCAVPALPSPSPSPSPSLLLNPNFFSHGGDDEEIKCSGDGADVFVLDSTISTTENETISALVSIPDDNECVSNNTSSVEIQPVKENRQLESTPDDELPSDCSSASSLSSQEEEEDDDEKITLTDDEIIFDNTKLIAKGQVVKQIKHKKTLRKSRSIRSDDKRHSPVKLKFRNGRVVELKPENNSPRRLVFRRTRLINHSNTTDDHFVSDNKSLKNGRLVGSPRALKDNQIKPSRSRSFISDDKHRSPIIKLFRSNSLSDNNSPLKLRFRRAREHMAEDNKSDSRRRMFKRAGDKNNAAGGELSSRKVTLKHHQDLHLQGKKDAQGLFNNVIEETASKLAESRTSKVKALVGAFETVISLQEMKPSFRN